MKHRFNELLQQSFKSEDTEEWLDVHFTRPIGLAFALMWIRLGVHPNAITVLSIFLGIGSAVMFYFTDWVHNLMGVLLLMLANFCDSTDGQMARLTGKKTLVGRILDGFAGDVWFFCIYWAIILRLWPQPIPGTTVAWGIWIVLIACVAGLLCHSPQSSLADYYRQIHLLFLKGRDGAELDNSAAQQAIYESLPRHGHLLERLFRSNYARYCRSQERRTPEFQRLLATVRERHGSVDQLPQAMREQFLNGSRPLMPLTNILTFNTRAIVLYITCLADCPWVYFLFEMTMMSLLYVYMHQRHERLCRRMRAAADQDTVTHDD